MHTQYEKFKKEIEIVRKYQTDSGAEEYNERNENCNRRHWQYNGLAKERSYEILDRISEISVRGEKKIISKDEEKSLSWISFKIKT